MLSDLRQTEVTATFGREMWQMYNLSIITKIHNYKALIFQCMFTNIDSNEINFSDKETNHLSKKICLKLKKLFVGRYKM